MRADKFLFHHARMGRRSAREAIAKGRLKINGVVVQEATAKVQRFDQVQLDQDWLQNVDPVYLVLHKPKGVVCATVDSENTTVIDLLDLPEKETFHLAGRLDKNTSGLVLITNDGHWSRFITEPSSKKPKTYLVETEADICLQSVEAFKEGIVFEKEKAVTHPAQVELIGKRRMRLTIYEGMHHQIKRMFLKFDNRVLELHRESVDSIVLDIEVGEYRSLTADEIRIG